MPSINVFNLPSAFAAQTELHFRSVPSPRESRIDIGELIHHHNIYTHSPMATVRSIGEFNELSDSVTTIIVDCDCCNEKETTLFDLSMFTNLKTLEVGSHSFEFVKEVKLIGLHMLERIEIGKKCFSGDEKGSRFHLRDCERLRELRIGCYSFNNYSVCEIQSVASLEVIMIGVLACESLCFCYSSLELKSESHTGVSRIGLPNLKSLLLGGSAFAKCHSIVMESFIGEFAFME